MSIEIHQLKALESIRQLESEGRKLNLVYIDPPFNVGKEFKYIGTKIDSRLENHGVSFNDKWGSLSEYMDFIRPVLEGIHRILEDDGSILVHCDHRANIYIAMELDRIFGMGDRAKNNTPGFRNEIVWEYGLGGIQRKCFPKKHDTILWYSKGDTWTFKPPKISKVEPEMGDKVQPDVIRYTFNNMNSERTGYPTQKPTQVVGTLVQALTNPGDTIADFFCGSGTVGICAIRYGCNAWLSDQSEDAIRVTTKRIDAALVKLTERS